MMVKEWLVQAVMSMYSKPKTVVKTNHGKSEKFEVKVCVHQDLGLSPFLFVILMEALTTKISNDLPWEILYADDLMVVNESRESLKKVLV